MKVRLVSLLLGLLVWPAGATADAPLTGAAGGDYYGFSVDWSLNVKAGLERPVAGRFSWQVDSGLAFFGIWSNDFFINYTAWQQDNWALQLNAGLPQVNVPLSFTALLVAVGGGVSLRCRVHKGNVLFIRAGEAFPFFFEEGKDVIREIQLPFSLWPDLTFGVKAAF